MSRRWERMVYRHRKELNEKRKKKGVPPLSVGTEIDVVKGRSLFLSFGLALIGLIMLFFAPATDDRSYWWTAAAYFGLALLYFFFVRPYVRIGPDELAVRRLFGEQRVSAASVKEIRLISGSVVVEFDRKGKTSRWVFTRSFQLYPIKELGVKLRRFAERNRIPFFEEVGR
ncbi:MAG: hypothetical protein BLM47_00320 [Candidatus Reconcilbacillus cellulovorans]|uniref:Low molecular weight protein antigen 6 PH domain-containing protein n=1 Tax=Candidatus Reconcilbacillus cellulovorans TaxID=1906605 RepID=A0A2A6E3J8_9BACL|nr:MAG: hypothetical protein BLM47_00320 [Candidatus Reconcilbacillus cellulovorans]